MDYVPFSPFMRPITRAHLKEVAPAETPSAVDKWQILRELSKAQALFGLSERDLTVLQGLLSFHRETELDPGKALVVFPSNKAICERLNGMANSTMRRHLAKLIDAGLIIRRDSPNGKRYARGKGDNRIAFGFDLSPLPLRAAEIEAAAEKVREQEERIKRLRETIGLMRRDLAAVITFGRTEVPEKRLWDDLQDVVDATAKSLRRRLPQAELEDMFAGLNTALDAARCEVDGLETVEMSTCDDQSEQHQQNSDKNIFESELGHEDAGADGDRHAQEPGRQGETDQIPKLPLQFILSACPEIQDYHEGPIRHWHQFYDAACRVRPAMGINAAAWHDAVKIMGPAQAAVVLAAMLERFSDIRSPGAYLRFLSAKFSEGTFTCGPMVMALMSRSEAA